MLRSTDFFRLAITNSTTFLSEFVCMRLFILGLFDPEERLNSNNNINTAICVRLNAISINYNNHVELSAETVKRGCPLNTIIVTGRRWKLRVVEWKYPINIRFSPVLESIVL